ncbi:MAG: SpoIIE family protein phosphatase [Bacillota bacterium]|nr:SpoIIE family protein phosphatase [Bacillota bacterium]
MNLFFDIAFDSLKKHGEELCGDMVDVLRLDDCIIIVLADGLGSGVKANILATLTSKIASTMLKEGADIYETVDTIVNTLPICKTRQIAYSTFTIVKIYNDGRVYIAEYDNPPFFILRNNAHLNVKKNQLLINEKKVKETYLQLNAGDIITLVSDGVIHAGLGNILNLGWSWDNVCNYLARSSHNKYTAQSITKDLISVCWDLYCGKPGDDTTVVTVKAEGPKYVNLFTGPPKNNKNDSLLIRSFIQSPGKKIICGGTAANIAERELGRKLNVNLDYITKDIPPIAFMEGIDLITEGVLTLAKAVNKIRKYGHLFSQCSTINTLAGNDITDYKCDTCHITSCNCDPIINNLNAADGASRLAKILLEECTHLTLWVGKAINPAHQNPNLPVNLNIKLALVEELSDLLKKQGKLVNIHCID